MSRRPSELDLLLRCCSCDADRQSTQLSELISRADPSKFLALAGWHQVRPLVLQRLPEFPPDPRTEILRAELREIARANAVSSLRLSAELLRLVDQLQRAGIKAVPFKGPALAERLHGKLALREFVDLDLFVPLAQVRMARAVLAELRYEIETPLIVSNDATFLRSECEYILRSANDVIVELHWDVAPRLLAYDVDLNGIWQRITSTQFCRHSVPAFDDTDLLLLLLLHGSKHGWSRLKWLCDVGWLLGEAKINYEFLLREAQERGYTRALLIGLELAGRLLAAPVPHAISARCKADRSVSAATDRVIEQMTRAVPLSDADLLRFRVLSRERKSDKLRVLGRTIFVPNQADYGNGRLRRGLGTLHYFARPLRLLRKRLVSTN